MSPFPKGHRSPGKAGAKRTKPAKRRAFPFRPLVECLEDRLAPAVVSWDGGSLGTGTDWNVAANWVGDVRPGPNDDAVIDVPGTITVTVPNNSNISLRSLTCQENLNILSGSLFTVSGSSAIWCCGRPGLRRPRWAKLSVSRPTKRAACLSNPI